jgi:hypothetical protein
MSAFAHIIITAGLFVGLVLSLQVMAAARGVAPAPVPVLADLSAAQPASATLQWVHGERGWHGGGRGWGGAGWGWRGDDHRWRGDRDDYWYRGYAPSWGWRGFNDDGWWRWHGRHREPDGDEVYFYSPYGVFGYDLD